jgi:hypothetical protein
MDAESATAQYIHGVGDGEGVVKEVQTSLVISVRRPHPQSDTYTPSHQGVK